MKINTQTFKHGLPILAALFLLTLFGCSDKNQKNGNYIEPTRTGEVIIQNEPDQPEVIMEGLQVSETGIAYGIDFGKGLPYRLSLTDGSFEHLAESGRGPEELTQPNQVYLVSDELQFINDQALDMITEIRNGEVIGKSEGFLAQNIWIRNTYGIYSDGKLITAVKDHQNVNELNFENVHALYIWDMNRETGLLHGKFSTTLDQLDSFKKYPLMATDNQAEYVYYVFNTDYSVFRLNIETGEIEATSRYRPEGYRERTMEFDHTNNYHFTVNFSREFSMHITNVTGIGYLGERLVVVWNNANQNYIQNTYYDAENYDHFGVVYDLPDLSNPREFTLPGKFLGTWGNRMLIEENDDVMEYTIGFYEFE